MYCLLLSKIDTQLKVSHARVHVHYRGYVIKERNQCNTEIIVFALSDSAVEDNATRGSGICIYKCKRAGRY